MQQPMAQMQQPVTHMQQPMAPGGQQVMMIPGHQPKSKVVGGLLAWFLGVFGVHNFHLDRTGYGVAQLLITLLTLGIGMIITGPWAFIEMILIFSGSINDGDGFPLE